MKFLFLFVLLNFSFGEKKMNNKKFELLFYQQKGLRPIGNDKNTFWKNKKYFDCITISSNNLTNKIDQNLKRMKAVELDEISVLFALVKYQNNKPIDTLYSDQFLEYWQNGKNVYKDTSGFFEKKFAAFFDVNN